MADVLLESNIFTNSFIGLPQGFDDADTGVDIIEITTESEVNSSLTMQYVLNTDIIVVSSIKKDFLYTDVLYRKRFEPMYKYILPNLSVVSTQFNLEFYNIYNILTALYNGNIVYNKYNLVYNEALNTLDIKYRSHIIGRINTNGDLSLSGKIYEGKTLLESMTIDYFVSDILITSTVTSDLTIII